MELDYFIYGFNFRRVQKMWHSINSKKGTLSLIRLIENSYRLSSLLLTLQSQRSEPGKGYKILYRKVWRWLPSHTVKLCMTMSPLLSYPTHPSSRWYMLAISHFISKFRKKELTAVFEWNQTSSGQIILKQGSLGRNHWTKFLQH